MLCGSSLFKGVRWHIRFRTDFSARKPPLLATVDFDLSLRAWRVIASPAPRSRHRNQCAFDLSFHKRQKSLDLDNQDRTERRRFMTEYRIVRGGTDPNGYVLEATENAKTSWLQFFGTKQEAEAERDRLLALTAEQLTPSAQGGEPCAADE
jgi:hypothetical protein